MRAYSGLALLTEVLLIRNLVCHELIGISAQDGLAGREAHLTVKLDNHERVLTWNELQGLFKWMSRIDGLIRDLTNAAMEKDAIRANARLLNWETFPKQK